MIKPPPDFEKYKNESIEKLCKRYCISSVTARKWCNQAGVVRKRGGRRGTTFENPYENKELADICLNCKRLTCEHGRCSEFPV